jgi:hypothetical protein
MHSLVYAATLLVAWSASLTHLSLHLLQVPEEDRLLASVFMGAAYTLLGVPLTGLVFDGNRAAIRLDHPKNRYAIFGDPGLPP